MTGAHLRALCKIFGFCSKRVPVCNSIYAKIELSHRGAKNKLIKIENKHIGLSFGGKDPSLVERSKTTGERRARIEGPEGSEILVIKKSLVLYHATKKSKRYDVSKAADLGQIDLF